MSYFRSIDHVGPPDINVVEGDDVLRGLGETEVCYESNIDAAWEPARQPPAPAACECIESLHGSQTFIVGYQALLEQEPRSGPSICSVLARESRLRANCALSAGSC